MGRKSITLDRGDGQVLFSSDCRFCLLFKFELKADGCTWIHISCVTFKHRNGMDFDEFVYYKDVAIIKYDHLFNMFITVLSANDEHLVIITGIYTEGSDLFHYDHRSTCLDVLHCGISPNQVLITAKFRRKLDEHIGSQRIPYCIKFSRELIFAIFAIFLKSAKIRSREIFQNRTSAKISSRKIFQNMPSAKLVFKKDSEQINSCVLGS